MNQVSNIKCKKTDVSVDVVLFAAGANVISCDKCNVVLSKFTCVFTGSYVLIVSVVRFISFVSVRFVPFRRFRWPNDDHASELCALHRR